MSGNGYGFWCLAWIVRVQVNVGHYKRQRRCSVWSDPYRAQCIVYEIALSSLLLFIPRQSDSRLNLYTSCRHRRATGWGGGGEHAPGVGGGGGRAALRGPVPRVDQPEFRAKLRRHGAPLPPEEPQHQQRRAGVHGRRAAHRYAVEPSLEPRKYAHFWQINICPIW